MTLKKISRAVNALCFGRPHETVCSRLYRLGYWQTCLAIDAACERVWPADTDHCARCYAEDHNAPAR